MRVTLITIGLVLVLIGLIWWMCVGSKGAEENKYRAYVLMGFGAFLAYATFYAP